MHSTLALAAAFAGAAYAVTAPSEAAPAGFVTTYSSPFQITAVKASGTVAKRDLAKRAACPTAEGSLVITLKDGVLTDQAGRIADIVANYQFQFDPAPGQAGYIYNGGFSVGSNSSIALGGSTIFYECQSGSFYNLYTQSIAPYCEAINIDIIPCGGSSEGEVSQGADGQPTITGAVTAATDGQPQASSATAISQISDGQPQAQSATVIPITQISDGQPQVPTGIISQISDGQIQAPTTIAIPITQISDGQPQIPTSTGAVISQISDGQPQVPTSTGAVISQISDGQPQVPTSTGVPISQISDGQPQVPTFSTVAKGNGTAVTSMPALVTGSGASALTIGSGLGAAVVAFIVALL